MEHCLRRPSSALTQVGLPEAPHEEIDGLVTGFLAVCEIARVENPRQRLGSCGPISEPEPVTCGRVYKDEHRH